MANHTIHDPPDFSQDLRRLEITDPGHADTFNPVFAQLINNEAFLKSLTDLLMAHVHTGAGGGPPAIGTAGLADGSVTPAKIGLGGGFEVYFNTLDGSVDIERPCEGIPYVHTDTAFTSGTLTDMAIV